MGTIVEVVVAADEFALEETTTTLDAVRFRLERVVAQSTDRIMPLLWVAGPERDALEAAFETDPTIEAFELVTGLEGRWLYQLAWIDRIETLVRTVVNEEAVLLEAKNTRSAWELKLLFLERGAIRSVREEFADRGITFDVHRIYDQREAQLGTHNLTDKQHRALTLALERGYYEIPRGVDASSLADALDVSHQALSELLRRAHEAVVDDAIGTNEPVLSDS